MKSYDTAPTVGTTFPTPYTTLCPAKYSETCL